jgi:hypothetical protein
VQLPQLLHGLFKALQHVLRPLHHMWPRATYDRGRALLECRHSLLLLLLLLLEAGVCLLCT